MELVVSQASKLYKAEKKNPLLKNTYKDWIHVSCVNIYRGAMESMLTINMTNWHEHHWCPSTEHRWCRWSDILHPAIIWLLIQKYLLPTPEQLHSSGCETPWFLLNTPPWGLHFSDLIIIHELVCIVFFFFIVCVYVVYEIATRNVWYNLVLHNDKLFLNLLWYIQSLLNFENSGTDVTLVLMASKESKTFWILGLAAPI